MSIDLNDITLQVEAEAAAIWKEFVDELSMPQLVMALRMKWASVPAERKEMIRNQFPVEYAQMERMVSNAQP